MSRSLRLALLLCSCLALPALAAEPYAATVAPLAKAPTVDGKLEEGEWTGALHLPATVNLKSHLIDHHRQDVYFGFTRDRLYFAIATELPPDGKLIVNHKYRDSTRMIQDDGIEIYVDPNRANRKAGEGDRRYYLYHGNSVGAFLDIAYDIEGAPDTGWNGDWQVANGIHPEQGVWIQEVSLPVKDLGLTPDEVIGRDVGILVARNVKRADAWIQGTWFPHHEAFTNVDAYPRIRLTKDQPTVDVRSFGGLDLHQGPIKLDARIHNPGPARQAKVALHIESSTMPKLEETKTIELPAGGHADYQYHVQAPRLHEDAEHKLTFQVTAPDDSETYLNYMARWTKAPDNRWPRIPTGPQPEKALGVAYYPSYDFAWLRLKPAFLELEDCRSAKVTITTSRGATLLTRDLTWEGEEADIRLELPDLLDDEYTVQVLFAGWDEPLSKTFERVHYPWEGNTIGITDDVIPPFEPMTVDGDKVGVVLREYTVDGLGLWRSLKAAGNVNAGGPAELLARPMGLFANDGVRLAGKGEFTEVADHEVAYTGRAAHPAVQVQVQTLTELDGCMRVELELLPTDRRTPLDRLYLDIPLKDELMPLYHVSTTGLRFNPAGAIPPGDGVCWDTRDFPDGSWYGNFKPYIWLGAEERGLCFFADNDAGWVLDVQPGDPTATKPCLELIREDGVLTLRVNLVQKPIKLKQPRKIVFGLMATPAKPMPEDWRTIETAWMGAEYWGSDENFACKYPRNRDLSPLDMMMAMRLGREFDLEAFQKEWAARNFGPDNPPHRKDEDSMVRLLKVSRDIARRSAGLPLTVYWEEFHSTSNAHPEKHVFWHEWGGGSTRNIVASYQDFAVWYAAEFVRRGMGTYFDNSFPMQAFDPVTTSAYELPNGQIQPSAGIWARRAYLRRIWTVHRQWGDPRMPPLMMIHMTNSHIVPYMVWNDSNLDLEWFYGDTPVQARYASDMLRAESLGRQSGVLPFALARGSHPRNTHLVPNREEMGAIFEIKYPNHPRMPDFLLDFGYGQPDCQVYNYWNDDYPVRFSDEQVKSILLVKGGQARIVLATWNGAAAKVVMAPDPERLGFTPKQVTDVRAEQTMPLVDGQLTLDLKGYESRVLDLR